MHAGKEVRDYSIEEDSTGTQDMTRDE